MTLKYKIRNKLALLGEMEFSIKLHTIRSGLYIAYIEGVTGYTLKKNIVFLSLKIDFVLQTVKTLMKCHIMWHFIWVYTVCQSTR